MADLKNEREIEVGQWVLLPLGGDSLKAQVIEDRGNLGVNGERLLRVTVVLEDKDRPREFEVPEADLIHAA